MTSRSEQHAGVFVPADQLDRLANETERLRTQLRAAALTAGVIRFMVTSHVRTSNPPPGEPFTDEAYDPNLPACGAAEDGNDG